MKVIHTELKVNLPNHEYTKVGIKPGLSVADALSKAMKKRNLDTKTYEAIMVSDPEKVSNFSLSILTYRELEQYNRVVLAKVGD